MFLYVSLLYCRYNFLQIISKINELHDIADQEQRCIQKTDFNDLEKNHVKFIFASKKTLIFHLTEYDLVVKRTLLINENNQEGEIAISVNHDNIVTTYITFRQRYKETRLQYLVMEYMNYDLTIPCNLQNINNYLICDSVCDALIYLHSRKIAHLDVKPSNLGATIIDNDNNKKREIGLLHIYDSILKNTQENCNSCLDNVKFNDKYIKTNEHNKSGMYCSWINIIVSCCRKQKNAAKLSMMFNQANYQSCGIVYKLFDFGLSCKYNENDTNTLDCNLYGTYPDIAHEIYTTKKFTLKTDVFNFGSLCYRLFYGKDLNKKGENESIVDYEIDEQQENRIMLQTSCNLMDNLILSCISVDPLARPELTVLKQKLQTCEHLI